MESQQDFDNFMGNPRPFRNLVPGIYDQCSLFYNVESLLSFLGETGGEVYKQESFIPLLQIKFAGNSRFRLYAFVILNEFKR